jgi:hypothetical protein
MSHVSALRNLPFPAIVTSLVALRLVELFSEELELKSSTAFKSVLTVPQTGVQMVNLSLGCVAHLTPLGTRSFTDHGLQQLLVFVAVKQDAVSILSVSASSTTFLVVMRDGFGH